MFTLYQLLLKEKIITGLVVHKKSEILNKCWLMLVHRLPNINATLGNFTALAVQ